MSFSFLRRFRDRYSFDKFIRHLKYCQKDYEELLILKRNKIRKENFELKDFLEFGKIVLRQRASLNVLKSFFDEIFTDLNQSSSKYSKLLLEIKDFSYSLIESFLKVLESEQLNCEKHEFKNLLEDYRKEVNLAKLYIKERKSIFEALDKKIKKIMKNELGVDENGQEIEAEIFDNFFVVTFLMIFFSFVALKDDVLSQESEEWMKQMLYSGAGSLFLQVLFKKSNYFYEKFKKIKFKSF